MDFTSRVYAIVRQIPSGKVATYGDVAAMAGNARAARAVGAAMSHNPDAADIPCHRVVGSDGSLHGYAFGGVRVKREKLVREGVVVVGNRVDLSRSRWATEY
jgi:methylated-DNA-protein-cysteine methyltransferase-like protein